MVVPFSTNIAFHIGLRTEIAKNESPDYREENCDPLVQLARPRCIGTASVYTYQPHHRWRTSSILPSTTYLWYAGSVHDISS